MYLIVSVDCIGFDHTLFIILYSAIFCYKHVNKLSVFSIQYRCVSNFFFINFILVTDNCSSSRGQLLIVPRVSSRNSRTEAFRRRD